MSGAAARTGSYKKIGERKDIEVASWEVPQKRGTQYYRRMEIQRYMIYVGKIR